MTLTIVETLHVPGFALVRNSPYAGTILLLYWWNLAPTKCETTVTQGSILIIVI